MAKFKDYLNPFGRKNPIWNAAKSFLGGTPEVRENVSNLLPGQEGLASQLFNAGQGRGAGGAFGEAADYYRGNLSDNPADFNAFAAPALRQYSQDIVPGISEQFAAMGAGGSGLSGSGFQNAQVQGATDLAERLGALRANLRQGSASGLANIGQMGLGNYSQNMVTQPGTQGFLSSVAPAIGTAAGAAIGGPIGAGIGNMAGNWFGGGGNRVGANTIPNWQTAKASPTIGTGRRY